MNEKLIINKKLLGEDGCRVFSIRLREELAGRLDQLAEESNRSRNELINLLLEYAVEHCEVK